MRILLDTNIIIYREDNKIIHEDLQTLIKIIQKSKIDLIVHPKSIDDIKKDPDKKRQKITLSKFGVYQSLKEPPNPLRDQNFQKLIGIPSNDNEIIDNTLLYALYKNAVNFLITEDKGIHRKAAKLTINERVLTILDAIDILKRDVPDEYLSLPPALEKTPVYNIDVNDPLFTSLKKNYPDFEEWFTKISTDGRECLVYFRKENKIGAILIYKIEEETVESIPILPSKNRLKICTFIVTHVGYKIGELLLKLSFEMSKKNNLSEIYLTLFPKKNEFLIDLISQYGFKKYGIYKSEYGIEDLYLKRLIFNKSELSGKKPIEILNNHYPNFYDGENVKKHIIPIQPTYFAKLFTDYKARQLTLPEFAGEFIVEGNTIKKAYICHSSTRKIDQADLLLFYRSHDFKAILSIGVVEAVFYNIHDINEITEIVGKRTVYSINELRKMIIKPVTVILFNHLCYLNKKIPLKGLLKANIIKRAPQSIMKISHEKYKLIKSIGEIDERFTFD